MLTTAPVPTVRDDIETHIVTVPEAFWNFSELPALVLNDVLIVISTARPRGAARFRSSISATACTTMPVCSWRGGFACRSCSNTTGRKSG